MGCLVILNLKSFPSSVYVSYKYLTCKRALKGISKKETVTATRKEALTFPLKQAGNYKLQMPTRGWKLQDKIPSYNSIESKQWAFNVRQFTVQF